MMDNLAQCHLYNSLHREPWASWGSHLMIKKEKTGRWLFLSYEPVRFPCCHYCHYAVTADRFLFVDSCLTGPTQTKRKPDSHPRFFSEWICKISKKLARPSKKLQARLTSPRPLTVLFSALHEMSSSRTIYRAHHHSAELFLSNSRQPLTSLFWFQTCSWCVGLKLLWCST